MSDPYSTHLPVLKLLGRHLPIRHVLEFGSGKYSTLEFLNRESFPSLQTLVSLEASVEWIIEILKLTNDERLELFHCIDSREWVFTNGAARYDLIFIDDGLIAEERLRTIWSIAEVKPQAVVVIHDFEQYQETRYGFDHIHILGYDNMPLTAVCWNGSRPELERLNGITDLQGAA